jgi:hypothetical protein
MNLIYKYKILMYSHLRGRKKVVIPETDRKLC